MNDAELDAVQEMREALANAVEELERFGTAGYDVGHAVDIAQDALKAAKVFDLGDEL